MIHKTGPITLIDLVDRIKELSNDTLLSTISANGQNEKINMIAPLETAGHGDVAFLASPKYREEAKNCKATALVLTEEDKHAIWGDKDPERITVTLGLPTLSKSCFLKSSLNRESAQKLLLKTALSLIRRLPLSRV